jgi:hypothetical protein
MVSSPPIPQIENMIAVFEMARCPGGYEPTGRKFLLGTDCPVFDAWGETGRRAKQEGQLALVAPLFEEILGIVRETVRETAQEPKKRKARRGRNAANLPSR